MTLYLDTSALVPLYIPEAMSKPVTNALFGSDGDLIVSELAIGEFGAALSKAVRMKRLSEDQANAVLSDFDAWTGADTNMVSLTAADMRLASAFVRRFELKLMMPDAIHIALCQRHHLKLVTLDDRLYDAAFALGIDRIQITA